MAKKKTGTREWSDDSVNIQRGCEHDCRYCYARYAAVTWYKRCTREQWREPVINNKKVDCHYGKRKGVVMFPTTHDITPRNISEYLCVLRKLLDAGNQVLIVSKPHWSCIASICDHYYQYWGQIEFRFTIGSANDEVLRFWEPGAPGFAERLACLEYAHRCGYKTSVSCEPYLDGCVATTMEKVTPYLAGSFWIGTLREFDKRVDRTNGEARIRLLKAAQTDDAVKALYAQLKDHPLVRWKDSIREIIGGEANQTPN